MGIKFYSKAASRHFAICLVALGVLLGILVVNQVIKDNTLPRNPETVELDKPATLTAWVDNEEVEIKLKQGITIKILGIRPGQTMNPEKVWAELEDGTRGYISCFDFDIKFEAQLDGKKGLKEVTIKELKEHDLVVEAKDGTTEEIYYDDVFPQWPRKWNFKYLTSQTTTAYISKAKFEKKFIGSDLEKNDKRVIPARYVVNREGQTYAFYPMWVLDPDTGMRFEPTVIYDKDGIAQSYIKEDEVKRAKFFVKIWPLIGPIMDNPVANSLIEASLYETLPSAKGDKGGIGKILAYVIFAIYLVFVLLWFYATPAIPVLLIAVLMYYPKLFYPLSNKALSIIASVISIVFTYIWASLLLAWGIMWLFLIPLPFAMLFIHSFACAPLYPSAPCGRCLKCRNIESMEFVDSVYSREYQKWMRETEYVKNLNKFQKKWTTWTDVTRVYSDGSRTTTAENVQHHTQNYTTDLYDDYKVLYNVKVYQNNYECLACGQHEHNFSEQYIEIDREYMGTHQETHAE